MILVEAILLGDLLAARQWVADAARSAELGELTLSA